MGDDDDDGPEVTCFGSRRIVVTAPHCIPLCRDGHPVHKKEEYTRLLALKLAAAVSGAALTWSKDTADRLGTVPDPALRDPNYLRADELTGNRWSQQLRRMVSAPKESLDPHEHAAAARSLAAAQAEAADPHAKVARQLQAQEGERRTEADPHARAARELARLEQRSEPVLLRSPRGPARSTAAASDPTLHIDLHGARDPAPDGHRAHIHLGLMAMKRSPDPRVRDVCEKLRSALAAELAAWACELCDIAPAAGVVGRTAGSGPMLHGYPVVQANPQGQLTGALDASAGRLTMTQQSVLYGCSHSVQIELSHTVRGLFGKKNDKPCQRVRASFAHAIQRAWARVTAQPSPVGRSPLRSPRGASPRTSSLPRQGLSPRGQLRQTPGSPQQVGAGGSTTARKARSTSVGRVRLSAAPFRPRPG